MPMVFIDNLKVVELARFSSYVAKKPGRPFYRVKISNDYYVDHYILLIFLTMALDNKRFQTLSEDQLVRSKATCSFKFIQ